MKTVVTVVAVALQVEILQALVQVQQVQVQQIKVLLAR
jgi:hypothetical protein